MSKKTKIFLIVEIIVGILIIGGAVFYVTYKPKESKETKQELTQEEREQRAIDLATNELIHKREIDEQKEK